MQEPPHSSDGQENRGCGPTPLQHILAHQMSPCSYADVISTTDRPRRMTSSGEERMELLDHLPTLTRLLDAVSGTAPEFVPEGLNHTLTDSTHVTDRHPGLLLDGGLDLGDIPFGQ